MKNIFQWAATIKILYLCFSSALKCCDRRGFHEGLGNGYYLPFFCFIEKLKQSSWSWISLRDKSKETGSFWSNSMWVAVCFQWEFIPWTRMFNSSVWKPQYQMLLGMLMMKAHQKCIRLNILESTHLNLSIQLSWINFI